MATSDRSARGRGLDRPIVPILPAEDTIPRIIHQTYPSKLLPADFQRLFDALGAANPGWEHKLHDDADIERFIAEEYGEAMLGQYRRIDPRYGACRADLFRYLLIYRVGGVYLDIKSTMSAPLDTVLQPDDRFLLCQWENAEALVHAGYGLHPELVHIPGGEYQQWHVVAAPGHPFLKAVIERLLANIERYSPWSDGVGKLGAVRLTGPIAYTLAIDPIRALHPHRFAVGERHFGLVYNVLGGRQYRKHFRHRYATLRMAVVRQATPGQLAHDVWRRLREVGDLLWRPIKAHKRAKRDRAALL